MRHQGKRSGRINRPCENVGFVQNTDSIAAKGARHKLYELAFTLQLQPQLRRRLSTTCNFFSAPTMSSHNSARARIEALTGVVAGIDTASTTVKRFFNGI